jgi:hypothetical protein
MDSTETFRFDGCDYPYWDNPNSLGICRRVEVPFGRLMLARFGRGLLEIGNVLAHHSADAEHVIVDLRERNVWNLPNYHNADVLTFEPAAPPAAVVSISTLEHVEGDGGPAAALRRALDWAPHALVTMPLGYRPDAVDPLVDYQPDGTRVLFLRRISDDNRWEQISTEQCQALTAEEKLYNGRFPFDNVLGIWLKGQPLG